MSSTDNVNLLISNMSSKLSEKRKRTPDSKDSNSLHLEGISAANKIDELATSLKKQRASEPVDLDEGEIHPVAPQAALDLVSIFSLFSDIRTINRRLQFRNISKRESVKKLREKVDERYLHLKSREYELQLIKDQITALSKQSDSMEQVELIPEEQFDSLAPEKYLNPSSEHEKMLNRLNYEYDERKRLQEMLHDLGKTKSRMNLQSSNFKKDFAKIKNLASSFANSSAPLKNAVTKLKPS